MSLHLLAGCFTNSHLSILKGAPDSGGSPPAPPPPVYPHLHIPIHALTISLSTLHDCLNPPPFLHLWQLISEAKWFPICHTSIQIESDLSVQTSAYLCLPLPPSQGGHDFQIQLYSLLFNALFPRQAWDWSWIFTPVTEGSHFPRLLVHYFDRSRHYK